MARMNFMPPAPPPHAIDLINVPIIAVITPARDAGNTIAEPKMPPKTTIKFLMFFI
jgi:hypothetical protein